MTTVNILGDLGYADRVTSSATYGRKLTDCDKFLHDAHELGYRVEAVDSRYFKALNTKGQIEGEWTRMYGGMMSWSTK
jgi:hypothetical protein